MRRALVFLLEDVGFEDECCDDGACDGQYEYGASSQVLDATDCRVALWHNEIAELLDGGVRGFCRKHRANADGDNRPLGARELDVKPEPDNHKGCHQMDTHVAPLGGDANAVEGIAESSQKCLHGTHLPLEWVTIYYNKFLKMSIY